MNGALTAVLLAAAALSYTALTGDGEQAAPARTATVSRGTLLASVSASGSVTSARTADLSFGTSGTVESIRVKVGDKVTKGQVLATLDDEAAQEAVTSAKAALDAAAEGDTATASGYSTYVSAKAEYNDALRQLSGTTMKAPFSGTITALNGTVGGPSGGSGSSGSSTSGGGQGGAGGGGSSSGSAGSGSGSGSSTGSGFLTIAATSRLEMTASFTEADIVKIKKGRPATVTFDALPDVTASGKVASIDQTSTTTDNVVQYGVRISLADPPSGLRLGQTGKVTVVTGQADDVLYVPAAAVRTAGGRSTVTVVQNGQRTTTVVETGLSGDQGVEIRSGLSEGTTVLLNTTTTGGGSGGRPQFGGGMGGGLPGGGMPGGGRP
ncbi:membrane fusion protein, macrolide-specific efflux system [Thermomonospora echinospora]|uniref:Membrane fusion protein, macrolide-specific efflux system n=1 Tax=Thermomonospora echinospora TaxID=1992 RepID=A0A1H6C943_9ACTN|nr:membrane fusion protein, macrolide-specific efflux system [Thermomonospora echinospora]